MKLPHPSIETIHSKEIGINIPIPKTQIECKIYPARILFFNIGETTPCREIGLSIQGPVEKFLLKLNLLVGRIEVSFKDKVGFYSYCIEAGTGCISLTVDRTPPKGLGYIDYTAPSLKIPGYSLLKRKESYLIHLHAEERQLSTEFLELGVHKKLDWQRIEERMDLNQIVPIWMRLGQFFSNKTPRVFPGTLKYLEELDLLIQDHQRNKIEKALTLLLQVGFEGVLSPRIMDVHHQGILQESEDQSLQSALPLLSHGAKLLRSLFIQEQEKEISILPCIPPLFRVGRFYTLTSLGDELLYEWTNGKLKILSLHSAATRKVYLILPKEIKHARLRTHNRERGCKFMNGGEILLQKDKNIFLDRFEK